MAVKATGKLKAIQGNELTVELDEMNSLAISRLIGDKVPSVEIDIEDGRTISPDQRKKIWALWRDISDFTGAPIDYTEDLIKGYTREIFNTEAYSLSNCSMTTANNTIYTTLEFCFRNDIPFATKTWDMIPDDYVRQWFCLRFRRCVICGRPADLAHYETVGIGRNRYQISESGFHYMALCRVHHTEQHALGVESFIFKYHIKPIKLTPEQIKTIQPRYTA